MATDELKAADAKLRPLWTFADSVAEVGMAEAEALGKISGPPDLVPAVAFGHLNTAWVQFLDRYKVGNDLKHFQITTATLNAQREDWLRHKKVEIFGIALVHDENTLAEFIYEGNDSDINQGPGLPQNTYAIIKCIMNA